MDAEQAREENFAAVIFDRYPLPSWLERCRVRIAEGTALHRHRRVGGRPLDCTVLADRRPPHPVSGRADHPDSRRLHRSLVACRTLVVASPELEHRAQKWEPVLRSRGCGNKGLEWNA
jgi:hypothetical protein